MVMGSLDDDSFSSLFHLTTNEMELSDRDQLAVTALAVLILYFLKRGGYFGGGDSTNKSNLRWDQTITHSTYRCALSQCLKQT